MPMKFLIDDFTLKKLLKITFSFGKSNILVVAGICFLIIPSFCQKTLEALMGNLEMLSIWPGGYSTWWVSE